MMATFHRAAGDRRGALSERYWGFSGGVSVEVFRRSYWELPIAEINRRAYAGVTAALRAAGA